MLAQLSATTEQVEIEMTTTCARKTGLKAVTAAIGGNLDEVMAEANERVTVIGIDPEGAAFFVYDLCGYDGKMLGAMWFGADSILCYKHVALRAHFCGATYEFDEADAEKIGVDEVDNDEGELMALLRKTAA
jgi:hypothetical protein